MELLEQVWLNHRQALLGFIQRRVSDQGVAEDILQEVFLKAHLNLDTLKNRERLQSWVYQITRNAVTDHYRRRRPITSCSIDLLQGVIQQEDVEEWWQIWGKCAQPMIDLLPGPYRTALVLADIEGLPLKQVASQLNISLPGAKSRVQRGRAKLKHLYLSCCQTEFDRRGHPICSPEDGSCDVDC